MTALARHEELTKMNEAEVKKKISILKSPKFWKIHEKMTIRGRIRLRGMYNGGFCITMSAKSVNLKTNVKKNVNIENIVNYL